MALTTATMLTELGRATGTLRRGGTTTASGTDKTAVDSGLIGPASYDDALKNWWLLLTSGTYGTLALRRLINNGSSTAYTASSGTMTWLDALAGVSGSGVTYQLYSIDPQYLVDALNEARILCQKRLWRPIVDFGVITGSRIFNGGFAHWSGGLPLGWTKSNSALTVARGVGQHGQQARLTGAYYLGGSMPHLADVLALAGEKVKLYATVYATAASQARIGLVESTTTYSSYHDGDSLFAELPTAEISIPAGDYLFSARLYAGAAESWFENVYTTGGPKMYAYPVPSAFIGSPTRIEICRTQGANNEYIVTKGYDPMTDWDFVQMDAYDAGSALATIGHIVFRAGQAPSSEYRMKWYGKGLLSEVTLLADSMEVDADTSLYLYAWAQYLLGERLAGEVRHDDKLYDDYMKMAEQGMAKVEGFESRGEHLSKSEVRRGPPELVF